MAIKKSNYFKEYLSQSKLIGEYSIPSQVRTIKDRLFENSLISEFMDKGRGFDGKQIYRVEFYQKFSEENNKNPEENVKYKSVISVIKMGDKNELNNPSDIEKFLLKEGFKTC